MEPSNLCMEKRREKCGPPLLQSVQSRLPPQTDRPCVAFDRALADFADDEVHAGCAATCLSGLFKVERPIDATTHEISNLHGSKSRGEGWPGMLSYWRPSRLFSNSRTLHTHAVGVRRPLGSHDPICRRGKAGQHASLPRMVGFPFVWCLPLDHARTCKYSNSLQSPPQIVHDN